MLRDAIATFERPEEINKFEHRGRDRSRASITLKTESGRDS